MSTISQPPGTATDPAELRFRVLVLAVQSLFGAWFLVHGLNYFVEFFRQPPGSTGPSHELINTLISTGLFAWIKVIEIVVGVLLLAQRYVPLAIVAAVPITLVIAYMNFVLKHDTFGFVVGTAIILAQLIMGLGYMSVFRPMLGYDVGYPSLRGLRSR